MPEINDSILFYSILFKVAYDERDEKLPVHRNHEPGRISYTG